MTSSSTPSPQQQGLLGLPNEILIDIFSYLDDRSVKKSLTVSRRWHEFAWQVFVRDLDLTEDRLVRLTGAGGPLEKLQPHVRTVNITILAYEHYAMYSSVGNDIPGVLRLINRYHNRLNSALSLLLATLRQSPGLKRINLRTVPVVQSMRPKFSSRLSQEVWDTHSEHPHPMYEWAGSPKLLCPANFPSEQLTDLTLDFAQDFVGFKSSESAGSGAGRVHICAVIGSELLPNLRRLRCRLKDMCRALVTAPESSAVGLGGKPLPLKLEEVIINTDVPLNDWCMGRYSEISREFVQPCGVRKVNNAALGELQDELRAGLRNLAARMKKPKMVRLIWKYPHSSRTAAWDALTGKSMWISSKGEWDVKFGRWADFVDVDALARIN
ncbi:hypothetical protein QBC42DRAFT_299159 [Cladorrhinum samala]|uniref:F-box domain-containing protein n=1 Tax=Cladorrhinum samala TaxID=585594 RepID=A0AAV9HHZ4_9PEZI|nr:hypothetical protein QBC42DRAFT_299159 [Cladorrhinum samala]